MRVNNKLVSMLGNVIRSGPGVHIIKKNLPGVHLGVGVERRAVEMDVYLAARRMLEKRSTHIFDVCGERVEFGKREGNNAVNELLRSVGSEIRCFSGYKASKERIVILGTASEEVRDGVEIFSFEKEAISSRVLHTGFSGAAAFIVTSRKAARANLVCLKEIASGSVIFKGNVLWKPFMAYVLKEHEGEGDLFVEHDIDNFVEHEFGHIRLKKSGDFNHTALSNVINHGSNILRGINEVLADFAVLRDILESSTDNRRLRALQWMTGRYNATQEIKPEFYAEGIQFRCISNLLFEFVSPDGFNEDGLRRKLDQIEGGLLELADRLALGVKERIESSFAMDSLIPAENAARRQGVPESAVVNFTWELFFRKYILPSQDLHRQLYFDVQKAESKVLAMFPFPRGFQKWLRFLV